MRRVLGSDAAGDRRVALLHFQPLVWRVAPRERSAELDIATAVPIARKEIAIRIVLEHPAPTQPGAAPNRIG